MEYLDDPQVLFAFYCRLKRGHNTVRHYREGVVVLLTRINNCGVRGIANTSCHTLVIIFKLLPLDWVAKVIASWKVLIHINALFNICREVELKKQLW